MATGWAVVGTHFEYDDERYTESGLQAPTKVFMNRASALKEIIDETFSFLAREEIEYFECGEENCIISEEGKKILQSYLPIIDVHCDTTLDLESNEGLCIALRNIGSIISSEHREEFYHTLNLRPYGLVEVSVEL